MGNEQPKKIARVNKDQINVGCLKAKIHLELVRDRKHQEVIRGEKELVAKVHSKSRNKTEEILIAERVVNGLKYAQGTTSPIQPAISSWATPPPSGDRAISSLKTCSTRRRWSPTWA
jgi:hypothetical protein